MIGGFVPRAQRGAMVMLLAAVGSTGLAKRLAGAIAEWPTYGGDLASTRYSALDQIDRSNFNALQVAWRFETASLSPRPEYTFQSTPLMVGGTLYFTAGTRRAATAVDAVTGQLKWTFALDEGPRRLASPRPLSGRGVAYWARGRDERILYVTQGYQLVALDAGTGAPVKSFGHDGIVDLKTDMGQEMDLVKGQVGLHSAPVVSGNVIIIGAAHLEGGAPVSRRNQKGFVRAYDVRTGKRLWTFRTIPAPGEFGFDSWHGDSAAESGNTGVWAQMSIDESLGLAYLPVELPTGDFYGGHRAGDTLFSESIVAVDLQTGKRRWHYQLVHHGLWDYDIPCAPILADLRVDGRTVKALAQITKQGWVYVLDRVTGMPVWPIPEKPAPRGDVPGEWYSPTQPFVTKPPAFERQGVSIDDLIDFTPQLRAEATALVSRYKIGPLFEPPVVSAVAGPLATLVLPSPLGGANWPGGSLDPETGMLYVFSTSSIGSIGLVRPRPGESDMTFIQGQAMDPEAPGGGFGPLTVQGLPLVKPPYGRITAIDLNQGRLAWQIPHGETPDEIKHHPLLANQTLPRTGRPGRIGVLTTKTLLVAGESGFATTPAGRGAMLRAYDKRSGTEVGAVYMPAPQTGSPMTYAIDGRQYLAVAVGGPGVPGTLMAFTLPKSATTPTRRH